MVPIKKIGKYNVIEMIGRGGMGIVYKATDPMLGRLVAIKMMTGSFADDPDLLKRFYREAQSTASLNHPNIVTVYDMGDQDGMPYLVMQFLEGESLQAIIKSRRELSLLTKTNYILQVCHGLHYAHERRITHRDVKPANIMVMPDGTVKIVDFGIARIGDDGLTRPGQVMGSIHYMSPEQIKEREVDARSDIFSLGTVMYEFLTFALPFEGRDLSATLLKILHDPPPPLSAHVKDYPSEFDAILNSALAKNKEDRYQTVDELAFDLAQVELQLRKEMTTKLLQEAERLIAESDWVHAKEQLQQLVKLDPQNSSASQQVRRVQLEMQKQRRCEHIIQLRVQAEEFVVQQDFDRALGLLEQALALNPEELEVKSLRDKVVENKARYYLVRECMKEADAARKEGDLDGALRSLERVLTVQPDNEEASRLHAEVGLEVAERDKRHRLQLWIAEASQEISTSKFPDALETLRKVEELDSDTPGLRELSKLAAEGAQQELSRISVEKAAAEITEALELPDPSLARSLAEAALEKFPTEPGLLKLKEVAEQQVEAQERHLWVTEQTTTARTLLQSGRRADALAVLESALQKYPGTAELESLMVIVRAEIQQELEARRRAEYTSTARDALRRKDYPQAIKTLEAARSETKGHYFDELLQFAKEAAAHFERQKKVDAALAQGRQLIDGAEYEKAIDFLESALREIPDEDLRILAASAQRQLTDYQQELDELIATAKQLSSQGRPADAVTCLEAQHATYDREARFHAALAEASQQQQTKVAIGKAAAAIRAGLAAGEFESAARQLDAARRDLGDNGELRQLELDLRARRARSVEREMETALSEAEDLVHFGVDAEALAILESKSDLLDRVPLSQRTQYDDLKAAISRRLEEVNTQPTGHEAAETAWHLPQAFEATGQPPLPAPDASARGLSPKSAALRAQQLYDNSVLELTPPLGLALPKTGAEPPENVTNPTLNLSRLEPPYAEDGGSAMAETKSPESSSDSSRWPEDSLLVVEKQLAGFVGSLARILVKRAASRTRDPEELYSILAASLDSKADRESFLARKSVIIQSLTKNQLPHEPLQVPSSAVSPTEGSAVELTPAAIDHAARMLARYIGPIAGIHAKRAARRAENLHALYLLMSEHVDSKSERSRFLREAGFSDS